MTRPTRASAAGRAYLDLRTQARGAGRATDEYLRLYALEGFLARLAVSGQRADFVLKGGVLLAAYAVRRPTADIDLAANSISNDVETVLALVTAVAASAPALDDGLAFHTETATAEAIRDEDEYSGVRVSLEASLATARLPFHVDVNVGDPIWPEPTNVTLPRLLGGSINVLGYPIAMVLTEKLVTAALRGAANTRWRHYADIYSLTRAHELVASEVYDSYRRVAAHRRVDLVSLRGLLTGFADAGQRRWAAWRERQRLDDRLSEVFADVVDHVITFADGCLHALPHGDSATWSPDACRWTATS